MSDDELGPYVKCGHAADYEVKITLELSKPKEYGSIAYVDKVKGSPLCNDCKNVYMSRLTSIMAELHKEDHLEEEFQERLDKMIKEEKELEI